MQTCASRARQHNGPQTERAAPESSCRVSYGRSSKPPNVPAQRPRARDVRHEPETLSWVSMQPAGSAGSFLHDYLYLSAIGHVIHLTSHVVTIGQQLQQANLPYVLYRILAAENTRHDQAIHLALCQRAMRCF